MDLFKRAFYAGLVAGTLKDAPIYITDKVWHVPNLTYWDYASMISISKPTAEKLADYLIAIPVEIMFGACVGIIIVYIVEHLAIKQKVLAGALLGGATWFSIRSALTLAQLRPFNQSNLPNAIINLIVSLLFGILVVLINEYLKHKIPKW